MVRVEKDKTTYWKVIAGIVIIVLVIVMGIKINEKRKLEKNLTEFNSQVNFKIGDTIKVWNDRDRKNREVHMTFESSTWHDEKNMSIYVQGKNYKWIAINIKLEHKGIATNKFLSGMFDFDICDSKGNVSFPDSHTKFAGWLEPFETSYRSVIFKVDPDEEEWIIRYVPTSSGRKVFAFKLHLSQIK